MTPADRAAVFEALYRADPDPWRFARSPYERRKYRATLAALPCGKFRSGLEVGCSIGVLTALLARRCRHLLALDVSETALREARRRGRGRTGLRLRRANVPAEWPAHATFDLIVLSEVLYFLPASDIDALAVRVARALRPGGVLLLANWTGPSDTPLSGPQAAARLLRPLRGRLRPLTQLRRPGYRIDVLVRPGSRRPASGAG